MPDGKALPSGEHPFQLALDAIGDDVDAIIRQRTTGPGRPVRRGGPRLDGSRPWRMESPDWACTLGLDLPHSPERRAEILAIVVRRLNEARRLLPAAQYEVTLAERPFAWDEATGFQPPIA